MKLFKIILFTTLVGFLLIFLTPASIKKPYIPYALVPYVNQYTFQVIDLLPQNTQSSKVTQKLAEIFIIQRDQEVSDLEIEQKKYEINNISIAQGLDFPKGMNLGKEGIFRSLSLPVMQTGSGRTRFDSFSPWIQQTYDNAHNNGRVKVEFWGIYSYDPKKLGSRNGSTVKLESLKQFININKGSDGFGYGGVLNNCKEFENKIYKAGKKNVAGVCIYEEKQIDENTYKKIILKPHVFSKDGSQSSPITLNVILLHKTQKGYFTYTYEKKFNAKYLQEKGDPFPELKDIFEKQIPEALENISGTFDNVVNLVQ